MRDRRVVIIAALLLASAHAAGAQTPPTKPIPPDVPSLGLLDFGVRAGPIDGDEARFERYRDLRPGATTLFDVKKYADRYRFGAEASNIGYRDQRYSATYLGPRLTVTGLYDSIPLNYQYDSPYVWQSDGNGTMTLDLGLRQQVQAGRAVGVPCAPGSGPTSCNAATSAAAIANRSIFNTIIVPNDMQVRREIIGVKAAYASPSVGLHLDASTTARTGEMPWNASFSFNNVNQFAVPIDQRNNELKAGTEWINRKGMVRLDYWGSYFDNGIQTLTWDNPIRATDFTPHNSSGYSNGNGPAQGQSALWPSNTLNAFGVTGMYKVLPKTTINGNVQLTYMRQNEALLPWTLNSAINNPAVLAEFPGLQALPRASAEAAVDGINALVTFNSRPLPFLTVLARYRYNDHHNKTPGFNGTEYVRFDAVPEEFVDDPTTPHVEGFSEILQITRKNFDLNGTFGLRDFGSIRVGYANERHDREGRGFTEVSENTFKLAYDARLVDVVGVRASLDTSRRRGDGFILAGVGDYDVGLGDTQPGLRYYDEADRDRTRGALIFSLNPLDMVGVYVQFATTRDTFLSDPSVPAGRQQFGLLNQDMNTVTVGLDVSPGDVVSMGVSYGRDTFDTLQRSRNSNPFPDPSWFDPQRNWELDNNEVVNTYLAYLDFTGLARSKADLRFGFERNDSDNAFNYGGPRIPALLAAGQFIPLPNVVNEWSRFTADAKYFVTPKVGFGLSYWYDKLDITDWNTIDTNGPLAFNAATGAPRIDWLGGLVSGYGNRPYSGGRVFARLLYRF